MYIMPGKYKTFVLSNLTYKYITMEDLLTPQISMDVEETPLDVGKDSSDDDTSSETGEPEVDDDEKVKLLLEETFTDNAQVPEDLTEFELEAKKNVFAIGEPAVQFQRLHCTACNIHLGSSPIGYFNRFIHPLLKVLLCKSCFEFYRSGEFDKDEDGSEMYCRWCGQGGKVMCCAQCAYVFCQKCVRQNLGKRTLELIKDSDDWLCFGCNPTQLINLKIICTSLYDFVQEEIRLSKSLNNIERLKVDHSVCCQKVKAAKRKRDEDYHPHRNNEWEEQKTKRLSMLKSSLIKTFTPVSEPHTKTWSEKEEAEVVCTPDLLSLMEDDPPPLTPMPKSAQPNNTGNPLLSNELNKAPLNSKEPSISQPKPVRPDVKKWFTIAPKPNMMMVCNTNNMQRTTPNFVRLQTPAIKFMPPVYKTSVVNSIPSQITPGTRHEWYDKAATVVSTITGTLSSTLMNLTKDQRNAKTVEQLANIHNKLQELLSSSVNSLIQVRKNLRTEFLADLNKLKFSNANVYSARNNSVSTITKPRPHNSANKENDDDDVIIVNSDPPANKAISEPPPLVKLSNMEAKANGRPYLKVRSVSQLLSVSSECITIPDDPAEDVIAVEEKDPLDLEPVAAGPETSPNEDKSESVKPAREEDDMDIKNALTESRIEQFVLENAKMAPGIPPEELKRILSVRVLLATDFKEALPPNRLKTTAVAENEERELTEAEEKEEGPKENGEGESAKSPAVEDPERMEDENCENPDSEVQSNVTDDKNEESKEDSKESEDNKSEENEELTNTKESEEANITENDNKSEENEELTNTKESEDANITENEDSTLTNEDIKDCDEEATKLSDNNDSSSDNEPLSDEETQGENDPGPSLPEDTTETTDERSNENAGSPTPGSDQVNDSGKESSKGEELSGEPVTADSGIEIDAK